MKKQNEDEKNELFFLRLYDLHILYIKSDIFARFKYVKTFYISFMVRKLWLLKDRWVASFQYFSFFNILNAFQEENV